MSSAHWIVAGEIERVIAQRVAAEVRKITRVKVRWQDYEDPHAATELAMLLIRRLTPSAMMKRRDE